MTRPYIGESGSIEAQVTHWSQKHMFTSFPKQGKIILIHHKQFKFFHPIAEKGYWGSLLGNSTSIETVLPYTDPFFSECRAYGRILQARQKGIRDKLAVGCHGYLYLDDKERQFLEEEEGLDLGASRLDNELRNALPGGNRIRAIVKDLARTESTVNRGNIRKALRAVKQLNSYKVYNRDIRADNFRGGYLVDFGLSWTEPHILLDAVSSNEARDTRLQDLVNFDDMVEEEEISTRLKALHPDSEYRKKLRPRPDKKAEGWTSDEG